ncbi:MAG: nucleotidyltransferase domain-containing protein [Spirochaetales bacterium]|jgi:predicted nucleotidyltransferase|nr:nucleotidyltransferase domain-containing protein [Spirochaetales bacterium]
MGTKRRAVNKQDALVKKILNVILQSAHPDKVILFGSIARGEGTEDSDYDFLIIKNDIGNERKLTSAIYRAFYENKIPVPVDLIAVDSEKWEKNKYDKNMIYSTASKEGIILYG